MKLLSEVTSWLKRNRTSVRMAFVLRVVSMALGSLFSLLWYRLLLRAMGDPLLGLFQNFQALTRLGGLGDFGITGALALKAGTLLGRKDETGLRALLASARTLFLLLSIILCVVFVGLSPWLPEWLNFEGVPGAGSTKLLFAYGGINLGLFILGGYFASLNYAHGTVTWPILPTVFFAQILAPFFHWRLALLHMPLWIQLTPYLGSAVLVAFLAWRMLKWSHPSLGDLMPLKMDRAEWKALIGASWWMYLLTLGTAIYVTTDRLVIGAVLGTAIIPTYQANYKVCELGITLIVTAAFVSFPKITQWIASPDAADRRRLIVELNRLSVFEIVLACIVTLGYLAFNNLFIGLWLDKAHRATLALQAAFACNLAVTCGGNAGIQLSMRAGEKGLKLAGLAALGSGLLNLGLSIASVKFAKNVPFAITGVAVATVIAQSIYSIYLSTVTSNYLGISAIRWVARCWALPIAFTVTAAVLKAIFPDDSLMHLGLLSGCYALLFVAVCWLAGMNREILRAELAHARALLFFS